MGDFERYLAALKERLGVGQAETQEILEEFESHLRDKASDLEAQGIDSETAKAMAVKHMGDPSDISRRMRMVYGYADWQDILLAVSPHLAIAGLFLFELCCNYFVIATLLACITSVTWANWRHGNPSKWSYSWIGYAIAAPAISLLISIHAVGYGAWTLLAGQGLPIFDPIVILLIGCAPFAMYSVLKCAHEMVKKDWLWISFATLPLPILGSWALLFHSYEIYMGVHVEMLGQQDFAQVAAFLGIALMTAFYLKVGNRGFRMTLLLVGAGGLGMMTSITMPAGFHLPNVAMMFTAYLALFAAPVLWKTVIRRQQVIHSPAL